MFLRTIISCQCQHPLLQCMLYVSENNHLMSMSTSTPTSHTRTTPLKTTILCQCQHPLLQCMPYVFENNHLMSMSTSTPTVHTLRFWEQSSYVSVNIRSNSAYSDYVFENNHLMSMSTSIHTLYVFENSHLMSVSTSAPTVHSVCFWEQPPHVNVNIHSYTLCSWEQACSTINTRMFEIKHLPNSLQSNTIIIFQNLLSVKHKFTYKTKAAQSCVENMSTFWGMGWGNYAYCPYQQSIFVFFVCLFVLYLVLLCFCECFCGCSWGVFFGGGACLCPRNKNHLLLIGS